MRKHRFAPPVVLVCCAALMIVAIVMAATADTVIRQAVFSAGAGTATNGKVRAGGILGQAITGRSSGTSTEIRGGWWTSAGSSGINSDNYMPLILVNFCSRFAGTRECEENDGPIQANGPLQFGQAVQGSLTDDNESQSDQNTEDWFYFEWSGSGTVSIDVTDFAPVGQVILYHESVDPGSVAIVADQASGAYHLAYDGAAGSGKYLIRLFVPGSARLPGAAEYTLVVHN